MSKRIKVLFFVMSIFLIGSIAAVVYFVNGYLKMKVAKFEVEQSLQQLKNSYALTREDLRSKDKKIEELKFQLNKYKRKVDDLRDEIDNLKDDKESLEKELEKIKEKFSDIDTNLDKKDAYIWRLKKELMHTRYRLFSVEQYIRSKLKQRALQNLNQANQTGSIQGQKENKTISLGKIVVNTGKRNNSYNSFEGVSVNGSVLSMNRKYNFIIVALPRRFQPGTGWRVKVVTEGGKQFSSLIDTARNNMITMDIPKNLDLSIGDTVTITFKEKI